MLSAQDDAAINGILQFLAEAIFEMGNAAVGFDDLLPVIIGGGEKPVKK